MPILGVQPFVCALCIIYLCFYICLSCTVFHIVSTFVVNKHPHISIIVCYGECCSFFSFFYHRLLCSRWVMLRVGSKGADVPPRPGLVPSRSIPCTKPFPFFLSNSWCSFCCKIERLTLAVVFSSERLFSVAAWNFMLWSGAVSHVPELLIQYS